MRPADVISALSLPPGTCVDRRIPKSLLIEYAAPTAAARRRIKEDIEEVRWVAALKPTTISVPVFRDGFREYVEIAVLTTALRKGAKTTRLAELIHRAIPYPVFLITDEVERLTLSLAHKRWAQGGPGAMVLEGELVMVVMRYGEVDDFAVSLSESLALTRQSRAHLCALYQGWIDALCALLAARVTGVFSVSASPEQATARRDALRVCARLEAQIALLRSAAAEERQVPKLVAINQQLGLLRDQLASQRAAL